MTNAERDEFLEKLRSKYKKSSEQHGKKIFNLEDLENRIDFLLQSQGNAELFFKNEMQFYDTLQNKADENIESTRKKVEFNETIDRMLAENVEKIAGYEDIFFSAYASSEIRRFIGALTEFQDRFLNVLKAVFGGTSDSKTLEDLLVELERYYVTGSTPTILLRHYIDEVKGRGERKRDEIERKLLQSGGLHVYNINTLITEHINTLSSNTREAKLQLKYIKSSDLKSYWQSRNLNELHKEVSEYIEELLENFRIGDLVRHGYRNR